MAEKAWQAMNILVAVTPAVKNTAEHALRCNDFHLSFCHTLRDARRLLLAKPFDIIVCTLQFDESRLCDLLQHVSSSPALASIPFVALTFWKRGEGMLSKEVVKSALRCATLSGATESIDLAEWRNDLGDMPAFEELRMRLRRLGRQE